jgi:hypothetical protein
VRPIGLNVLAPGDPTALGQHKLAHVGTQQDGPRLTSARTREAYASASAPLEPLGCHTLQYEHLHDEAAREPSWLPEWTIGHVRRTWAPNTELKPLEDFGIAWRAVERRPGASQAAHHRTCGNRSFR